MKAWPDCIPCILKMSVDIARNIFKDEEDIRVFFERVMSLRYFKENKWNITPPEIIKDIWQIMEHSTGIKDFLAEKKRIQNDIAMDMYPSAKSIIKDSNDPFAEALKWSISGNFIDIMAGINEIAIDDVLARLNGIKLNVISIEGLKKRIGKARRIVYLCDNCGEIVFDRLFGELLKEYFQKEIVFVVRTTPVLNDATMDDAIYVGLNTVGDIIENDIDIPLPGMILNMTSNNVRRLLNESDLIISKGGGNFDTLSEEGSLRGKLSFLLQAKCQPYVSIHGVKKGDLIINNF
ncbi:MAG TPA: ARMT1-like domain-containing protein [Syntrophorhabdaceae bacterium]|nr:ARMT1-like domain-containing protein [Syntrophorhabdaceae bacterium]